MQWPNVIEVIQGTVETVSLPEKVDIIIAEWMGYFLMRESMLDSVIIARDKFLKEGGSLYPSHCRMMMVRITSPKQHATALMTRFSVPMSCMLGCRQGSSWSTAPDSGV
jgi:predicted RNA methylase